MHGGQTREAEMDVGERTLFWVVRVVGGTPGLDVEKNTPRIQLCALRRNGAMDCQVPRRLEYLVGVL